MTHVVQVSFYRDPLDRKLSDLLAAWPSMTGAASALVRRGLAVTLLLASGENDTIEHDGVRYRSCAVGGRRRGGTGWWRGLGRMLRAVEAERPDVVHVHGWVAPIHVARLIRAVPRVPVALQDHAARVPRSRIRRLAHRTGFGAVDGALFTASGQARPFVDAGVLGSRVPVFEVIEGSTTFSPGDRPVARAMTGVTGDPALLWVGRLDDNKDPMTVLDAFERIAVSRPRARLGLIYSEAPLIGAVRRRIASSSCLASRVRLIGRVPHAAVEAHCRAADLFVLGSHREGSGYALIEALACGTPAVVSKIPSFEKIVGSDGGMTFDPGDAAALVRGIERILQSEDSEAVRERVRRHFDRTLSYDAVAGQLLDAYDALTGAR